MSTDNPWKTLSSKVMYQNPWISVREDQVIRPDGSPGIYGVVETKVATGVVALTPEHKVILVGQYRYPLQQYSWEIVEGGAEHGEDPFVAIQRELEEEVGRVLHGRVPYHLRTHAHTHTSPGT
ncbi:MAG: NUDIX hydrolase, partial [Proteobacteria bacterium]|nr:NUDIX hydrolase [Pseudomonadota bacterium]